MTSASDQQSIDDQAVQWLLRVRAAPQDSALQWELAVWLSSDASRQKAYRRAERVWQLSAAVPPAHVEHWATVPADNVVALPVRSRWPRIAAAVALAACLLLAVLPVMRPALFADAVTETAELRQLTLEDGSTVTLDSDSAINMRFAEARRAVTLVKGRAFFQVAPDRARPFTVAAGETLVTVLGTAFDVRLDADFVTVTVESGSVQVAHGDGSVALRPGDRLRIARSGGAFSRDRAAPGQIAAWRNGRMIAVDMPVAEAVAELRRYHRGVILLTDADLAQRHVTGVYDLHDPLGALRAVLRPHGGHVTSLTPYLLRASRD